jgi:hypothetical protein
MAAEEAHFPKEPDIDLRLSAWRPADEKLPCEAWEWLFEIEELIEVKELIVDWLASILSKKRALGIR